jgi:hypothetical protein
MDVPTLNIEGWPTFTAHTIATNLTSWIMPNSDNTGFPEIPIKEVRIPSTYEIIKGAFNPTQSLPIAVHIIGWTLILLIIAMIAFCCKKTRCYSCLWAEMNKVSVKIPGKRRYAKRIREAEQKKETEKRIKANKLEILRNINNSKAIQEQIPDNTLSRPPMRPNNINGNEDRLHKLIQESDALTAYLNKRFPESTNTTTNTTNTLPARPKPHLVPYPSIPHLTNPPAYIPANTLPRPFTPVNYQRFQYQPPITQAETHAEVHQCEEPPANYRADTSQEQHMNSMDTLTPVRTMSFRPISEV